MKRRAKPGDQIYHLRGDRNVPCCTHQKTRKLVEALGRSYERDGTAMTKVACCNCFLPFEELSKVVESGIIHGECMICLSCEYDIVCDNEWGTKYDGTEGVSEKRPIVCAKCGSQAVYAADGFDEKRRETRPFCKCIDCG